jgi:hypothetical protein
LYSGAKSSVAVIFASVVAWLNCELRSVWVMRAVRLISGDVAAVGSRTFTVTMSPTDAAAQNGHAAGCRAASTVTACTRFAGLR